MNSCIYDCQLMHYRLKPKKHRFVYSLFMFYLDLDEIDLIVSKIPLISHNRFNIYNFKDKDHLDLNKKSLKKNILEFLQTKGINLTEGRIMLLTYLRTLGYIFNPVSFYFCFDKNNNPVGVIPEVGNTFGELKPFWIGQDALKEESLFQSRQPKHFYVSPFVSLDTAFDFQLRIPAERCELKIDDYNQGEKFFLSSLIGKRKELSMKELVWYSCRFPLITVKVISLIHWHAFLLWLKKIPFFPKEANPDLQRNVYRAYPKDK